jgi:hypothetical protein
MEQFNMDDFFKFDRFENSLRAEIYLNLMTSLDYWIFINFSRKWGSEASNVETGKFYQIKPAKSDDGFFDWYCKTRPYHQSFISMEVAVLHFLAYRKFWQIESSKNEIKKLSESPKLEPNKIITDQHEAPKQSSYNLPRFEHYDPIEEAMQRVWDGESQGDLFSDF